MRSGVQNSPRGAPSLETTNLKLTLPAAGPLLYTDSGAAYEELSHYVAGSQSNAFIRVTGGCIDLSAEQVSGFTATLGSALHSYAGTLVSGGTLSRSEAIEGTPRASVPECVGKLVRIAKDARHVGVIPGATLNSDTLSVCRDGKWNVVIDPSQAHVLVSSQNTPYFWDSEWRAALALRDRALGLGGAKTSVLVSFDGGLATQREVEAWADLSQRDSTVHVILLGGGNAYRATDTCARRLPWLRSHPHVHLCPCDPAALYGVLMNLGAVSRAPCERTSRIA